MAGEEVRQHLGIDGTAGDAQDVDHPYVPTDDGACLVCGLAATYRRHTLTWAEATSPRRERCNRSVETIRDCWAWINRREEAAADGILWNDDEAMDVLVQNAQHDIAALLAEIDRLATPIRFDPDDRSTWPEDGRRVLANVDLSWDVAYFKIGPRGPYWADLPGANGPYDQEAQAGDLWLPLPPTPEGGE